MALELMNGKAIDKGISSIATRSATLSADIHTYGVQALLHAHPIDGHNDPRKVDNLLKALHKANRPEAFKTWVTTYSPIRWDKDGKATIKKGTANNPAIWDIEGADANPYFEAIEKVGKPLTLEALKAMVMQIEKRVKSAEKANLIGEGENIVEMRAFAARAQQLIAA